MQIDPPAPRKIMTCFLIDRVPKAPRLIFRFITDIIQVDWIGGHVQLAGVRPDEKSWPAKFSHAMTDL